MADFTNRLINETSPYLLQHAHNPVDWYPWADEALRKAKEENKPILISIGYAACHWCHVMEKESFEDRETADLMNANFINIKIDREERPDLDHIYMDAVQAMTGSGGWPLNVFLTPDAKPFYGGTYFPPNTFHNRPAWKDVLKSISESFKNKTNEIETQAQLLTEHLVKSNAYEQIQMKLQDRYEVENIFNRQNLKLIYDNVMKSADTEDGGFGRAPKFPQTFIIRFLLNHYYFTKNKTALEQACLSLDKMIHGGIYDQIGGGFARYSTDNQWLIPHFEKMLYDNALLLIVLSEGYQLTGNQEYKRVIEETIEFIKRELSSSEGGFYSSLDADSEGEEGKYYVWDKNEIEDILKADSELFCSYYHITESGNWGGKNILYTTLSAREFSNLNNISEDNFARLMEGARQKLIQVRLKRVPPKLDNKILLSWNALMNIAICKASAVLGNDEYRELAVSNMNFLLRNFSGDQDHLFFHCITNGKSRFPAFLDDYSFLASALIHLQEITADTSYLVTAKKITEYVINNFSEPESGLFFYTHNNQNDVIIRKKEIYDGAIPSGNSVMASNLIYLSRIFNKPEWHLWTLNLCSGLNRIIINYPTSFGIWATLFQAFTYHIPEIVIAGKKADTLSKDFLRSFIPFKVFQSTTRENEQFPLLVSKPIVEKTQIYLCKNYSCQKPLTELRELIEKLAELTEN